MLHSSTIGAILLLLSPNITIDIGERLWQWAIELIVMQPHIPIKFQALKRLREAAELIVVQTQTTTKCPVSDPNDSGRQLS